MTEKYQLGTMEFVLDGEALSLSRIGDYAMRADEPQAAGLFLLAFGRTRLEGWHWRCVGVQARADEIVFTLRDREERVELHSVWRCDPDCRITSRRDTVKNLGRESLTVRRFLARLPLASGDYEVYSQHSRWSKENQGAWSDFPSGMLRLTTRWGRTTEGGVPFAGLRGRYNSAALAFHILPEGNWMMRFHKEGFSNYKTYMNAEFGQSDEDFEYELRPGATLATPEILIQELPGREIASGSALLHRYALNQLAPPCRDYPVVYNTWLDKMTVLKPERLRRQLDAAERVGCEAFVVDAGWFESLGDWRERRDAAFMGRMADFGAEVRRRNMRFGIWFEPEAVSASAPVVGEHPEWFVETNPLAGGLLGGRYRIKLESRAGQEYLYQFVSRAIRDYGLGYVKFDMNNSSGYDASGEELIGYAKGFYAAIERLRRDFPEVVFENCSSGALRTDLRTLKSFDGHFISDNANCFEVIRLTQGMLPRFPAGRMFRWLVLAGTGDWRPEERNADEIIVTPRVATWYNFEVTNLEFALCATMMGQFGLSGDIAALRPETLAKLAAKIAFYKSRRATLGRAEVHLLTPPEPVWLHEGWAVFEYHDPQTGEIDIFAFHLDSDGDARRYFPLRSVNPAVRYREAGSGQVISGAELSKAGLGIDFGYDEHGEYRGRWLTLLPESNPEASI